MVVKFVLTGISALNAYQECNYKIINVSAFQGLDWVASVWRSVALAIITIIIKDIAKNVLIHIYAIWFVMMIYN